MDPQLDFRLANLEKRLDDTQRIIQMILLASGGSLPITSVASVFSGNRIGTTNRYLELYANSYPRLVALKVVGDFAFPGAGAKLSLQQSDNGVVSILSSIGLTTSDTIWLKPRQALYINTNDPAFTLDGTNFRVLLFDPLSFTVS